MWEDLCYLILRDIVIGEYAYWADTEDTRADWYSAVVNWDYLPVVWVISGDIEE